MSAVSRLFTLGFFVTACFFTVGIAPAIAQVDTINASVAVQQQTVDGEWVAPNTADGEAEARKVMEAEMKRYRDMGCVVVPGTFYYHKKKARWVWTFEVIC